MKKIITIAAALLMAGSTFAQQALWGGASTESPVVNEDGTYPTEKIDGKPSYLLEEFEIDPKSIWQTNIFGKSLHELVNEGLHNKLYRMPEDAQYKLQETLQKIINEGSGGLICIIL